MVLYTRVFQSDIVKWFFFSQQKIEIYHFCWSEKKNIFNCTFKIKRKTGLNANVFVYRARARSILPAAVDLFVWRIDLAYFFFKLGFRLARSRRQICRKEGRDKKSYASTTVWISNKCASLSSFTCRGRFFNIIFFGKRKINNILTCSSEKKVVVLIVGRIYVMPKNARELWSSNDVYN